MARTKNRTERGPCLLWYLPRYGRASYRNSPRQFEFEQLDPQQVNLRRHCPVPQNSIAPIIDGKSSRHPGPLSDAPMCQRYTQDPRSNLQWLTTTTTPSPDVTVQPSCWLIGFDVLPSPASRIRTVKPRAILGQDPRLMAGRVVPDVSGALCRKPALVSG